EIGQRAVGRAVVDDANLDLDIRVVDGRKAARKQPQGVPTGNDDSDRMELAHRREPDSWARDRRRNAPLSCAHAGGSSMSKIARLAGAAMRPLATTEGRKRSLVMLVALPLTAALALGAALGALAERHGWSAPTLIAIGVLALLASALVGRKLLATAQS